jgi:beta-galactosidase
MRHTATRPQQARFRLLRGMSEGIRTPQSCISSGPLHVMTVAMLVVSVLCAPRGIDATAAGRLQQPPRGSEPQRDAVFPMAVWYGGGTARAPMLERDPRAKKDAWRRDFQQIRASGFNAIRCWIDWATGEPSPGQYRFDTIGVLLELAEETGLRVIVQVYMDSAPEWVGRAHPDARFVSSNGEAITPESAPGYCLDHEAVRRADLAFYSALAARASRSPALIGFDLWSEPHVINWATPTWIDNPEFCFCANTQRRFRLWLQRKYGSLDALNAAWYRRFAEWDDISPSRVSTILSFTDYIDWKGFIADKLAEDLHARYRAVKDAAPQAVAVSHAAGVGLFSSPHWWEGQSDDWAMAAQVDYYGTSFYPKHSAFVDRDAPWRAALLDFTRSFGYDEGRQGFWIGELQGGFGTIALNVSPTVTASDLRMWTWSALARGAKGIAFYAWYPMSTGYESGGFGLNQLDGSITDRSRAAGAIARTVDVHHQLFLDARPPRAQVAIVYTPLVHFVGGRQRATPYGGPQGEVAGIERDSLLGIHRALFPTNVPVDYVHADRVTAASLAHYRLLFLPYPPMLPERLGPVLREYVEQGGTLVAEARPGWNNERGRTASIVPGLGLHQVLGCREAAIQTGAEGRTTLQWNSNDIPGISNGDLLPARWYKETLEPTGANARAVATFAVKGASADDRAPAAVLSRFGRGRTLTLGSYVSAAYQARPDPTVQRFYSALLDWAGVERPVTVDAADVEIRTLERGGDLLVFVFNHAPSPRDAAIALRVTSDLGRAADIETGAAIPLATSGGLARWTLHLDGRHVRVLHLSP